MKKFSILLNLFFFGFSVLGFSLNTQDHMPLQPLQYGSFFTKDRLTVAPEHPIIFDCENVLPTKGIEHPEKTGEFILKNPGIYRVTYSVSLREEKCSWSYKKEESRRVALSLDGHIISGSEMFIGEDEHLGTLSLLIKVCGKACCDHVLRVINNTSLAEGFENLHLKSGHDHQDVTASIVIERVADCVSWCCKP